MRTLVLRLLPGLVVAGLAVLVLALDVVTKRFAEDRLGDPVELGLGAQLSLSHNSGVAFGVLSGAPDGLVIVAVLVAVATLVIGLLRGWLPASGRGSGCWPEAPSRTSSTAQRTDA